jgi:hypothetical protein
MPTTADGYVYPDLVSGGVDLAAHYQNLAVSVQARRDLDLAFTSWTPTWDTAAGGGFLSVGGSGFNQGHYQQIGKTVHAEFRIELASGFSVDSGTFVLILPVAAYLWSGSVLAGAVGHWTARNDSDPFHYSGTLGLWDNTATRVSFNGTPDATIAGATDAVPRSRMDSNDPIAWAAGDVLSGNLTYRAA